MHVLLAQCACPASITFCIAVPALAGRTALQAYTDFMAAFRDAFSELLGSVVTDADIGLGPRGEFRYPSTPLDSRWNFPGIGEFQVGMILVVFINGLPLLLSIAGSNNSSPASAVIPE